MSERSVEHATFVVERRYEASPERAFAAWADQDAKARWFVDSDAYLELDFRVSGRESSRGTAPDGNAYTYEAIYQDIVPARRIVYTYEMLLNGMRISVSLATAEFEPERDGTRLVFTEQGAFLDGYEMPAQREHGMGSLLDSARTMASEQPIRRRLSGEPGRPRSSNHPPAHVNTSGSAPLGPSGWCTAMRLPSDRETSANPRTEVT
jgi:uncharacterized protein YndB with AHSA1/START domain